SYAGIPALIFMAGYLGTTTFGALTLLMSRYRGTGRRGLAIVAFGVLAVTLLWIHPWRGADGFFGFWAGLVVSGLIFLGARYLSEPAARFLASFLAVQLCLNA